MFLENLKKSYHRLYNVTQKLKCCSTNRNQLKENKKLKNRYQGKRCFIIGNGPSLKTENLLSLKNEFVFTVNQCVRNKDFNSIKTNFHFWLDSKFFDLDESTVEGQELLSTMKKVVTEDNKPICFYPLSKKNFVEKHHLHTMTEIRYYSPGLMFTSKENELDYAKITASFNTVVQNCITAAIYMGFNEIYLLGCDNTSLLVNIKSYLNQNDDRDYSYNVSENEKERMNKMVKTDTLENYVRSYLKTLIDYRRLYEYCCKKKIKLINCSSSTVIDSIPRMSLKDIIN